MPARTETTEGTLFQVRSGVGERSWIRNEGKFITGGNPFRNPFQLKATVYRCNVGHFEILAKAYSTGQRDNHTCRDLIPRRTDRKKTLEKRGRTISPMVMDLKRGFRGQRGK